MKNEVTRAYAESEQYYITFMDILLTFFLLVLTILIT